MGPKTLESVWQRLAWAFNALAEGKMPATDWQARPIEDAGRQLAGGWRFAMIGLRGDWEFYNQACGFPTSQSVPNMCWLCNASPKSGDLCWTKGSKHALWRRTLRSHEKYLAELSDKGKPIPALFQIRTLRLEGVFADVLHTIDQGVASHLVGNIMHDVMRQGHWGNTQSDQAAKLDQHLKAWYKSQKEGTRIDGKITFQRVKKSDDWPRLLAKAAPTRRLAPYALALATEFDRGSEHDKLRKGAAQALVKIYDIFEREPRFPSMAARGELADLSVAFMGIWGRLSSEALSIKSREWKMSPKFHLMQHILEHQSWLNPRCTWTYSDEDLQRILKSVALSCHPTNVPHMVLFKWAVATFD